MILNLQHRFLELTTSESTFILSLFFKLDETRHFTPSIVQKLGYDHELKRLKRFTKSTLYQGIFIRSAKGTSDDSDFAGTK